MTPPAVERASLHEEGDPDTRTIMNCISFYIEYQAFHLSIDWSAIYNTGNTGNGTPAAERLPVIEHKAVIEPSSKTVHHKPVINSPHIKI